MTGLEFCRSTAPSPFLDASACRVVAHLGLKYGSVMFLEISSFVNKKATCRELSNHKYFTFYHLLYQLFII